MTTEVTPHLEVWPEKYATARPRRLLALDGGGILGIIALEILKEIETQLAAKSGQGSDFRLGRYFDYVGGTSTGAIIATALAIGMSVNDVIEFYKTSGAAMFTKAPFYKRLWANYKSKPLTKKLQDVLGNRTFGAQDLQCLLLIVTYNANTNSPWPVSNNPFAKYNHPRHPQCNLKVPLWKLVRASTAAPTFFAPEEMHLDSEDPERPFFFVDGGVTPYNNPAYALYRMATLPSYRLNWPTGESELMLVSVGTGSAPRGDKRIGAMGRWLLANAKKIPSEMMSVMSADQDINCRTAGRCVFGREIDRELGDMIPRSCDPLRGAEIPLSTSQGKAFLYARYDPLVDAKGIEELGLTGQVNPAHVQEMDKPKYIDEMQRVGAAYAKKYVDMSPFERFN